MSGRRSRRLLIVGLDGGTFDVLDPLMESGRLPFLREIASEGLTAELLSTSPPVTPVAWSTFMTGMGPGKHGILDFRRFDPHRDEDGFTSAADLRAPTLWERLSDQGLSVGVLDLPMTWPPPAVRGFVVSGFDTPADTPFTYPPELQDELLRRFPRYRPLPSWGRRPRSSARRVRRFARRVEESFRQRTDVALWLAERHEPDVLMVQFQALDLLQHRIWGYLRADPRCQPGAVSAAQGAMTVLDGCVRRLVTHPLFADGDTVVVSDHGFGTSHGTLYPNVLLEKAGLLERAAPAERKSSSIRQLPGFGGMWKLAGRLKWEVLHRLRRGEWIETLRSGDTRPLRDAVRGEGTRAVMGMGELCGFVWVLPRGDEHRAQILERARAALAEARLPGGGRAFDQVVDCSSVFTAIGDLPDLMAVPAAGWKCSRDLAEQWLVSSDEEFAGTHRPEGVMLARGRGFRTLPSRRRLALADAAPTLLHLLDLPVPTSMDGASRADLLTTEDEVRTVSEADPTPVSRSAANRDREKMESLLRGLGYLG